MSDDEVIVSFKVYMEATVFSVLFCLFIGIVVPIGMVYTAYFHECDSDPFKCSALKFMAIPFNLFCIVGGLGCLGVFIKHKIRPEFLEITNEYVSLGKLLFCLDRKIALLRITKIEYVKSDGLISLRIYSPEKTDSACKGWFENESDFELFAKVLSEKTQIQITYPAWYKQVEKL